MDDERRAVGLLLPASEWISDLSGPPMLDEQPRIHYGSSGVNQAVDLGLDRGSEAVESFCSGYLLTSAC
jgi:hypothetical protein